MPALGLKPLDGFRAEYLGLGSAALYTARIGGKDVNLIAKYLFGIDHENRFDSDYLFVSAAFKL